MHRRQFLKSLAGASISLSGGAFLLPRGGAEAAKQPAQGAKHAQVMVGGRRVKTIDVHCHVDVPGIADFLKGTPLERAVNRPAPTGRQLQGVSDFNIDVPLGPERLAKMDEMGIDVQAVSINAFWYSAERDLASRPIHFLDQKLAAMVKATNPGRFVSFASV